jgi:hypothetical protein
MSFIKPMKEGIFINYDTAAIGGGHASGVEVRHSSYEEVVHMS